MAYDDWKLATPPEYAEQPCVFDDSTECGCPRCVAAEDRLWDERGGDDDLPEDDGGAGETMTHQAAGVR